MFPFKIVSILECFLIPKLHSSKTMKRQGKSTIAHSFVYIVDTGKQDEKTKRILFPSNYDSLMKSVNYLYRDKFVVKSIYTQSGIRVLSTADIAPGMLLIVSPNEPASDDEESQIKQLSLYPNQENNQDDESLSDENDFGIQHDSEFSSQNQTTETKTSKIPQQSRSSSRKNQDSMVSQSSFKSKNSKSKVQNSQTRTKPTKTYNQRSRLPSNTRRNKNKKTNAVNEKESEQQFISQLPADLYDNQIENQNENLNHDEEANLETKTEEANEPNPEITEIYVKDSESEIASEARNYYERESNCDIQSNLDNDDITDGQKSGAKGFDDSSINEMISQLIHDDTFLQHIQESIECLSKKEVQLLEKGQQFEEEQKIYWFLRSKKYFEEQNIGNHGNYMYSYESMKAFVKNIIEKHRTIIYPSSAKSLKQHKKKDNETESQQQDTTEIDLDNQSTATNNDNCNEQEESNPSLDCLIGYTTNMQVAICGPRKSGKSTILAMLIEELLIESLLNGSWKRTLFHYLNITECQSFFTDFKMLYSYFIESTLHTIVLQKPEFEQYHSMLLKYFTSIFEYTTAPKIKKMYSTKPQFAQIAFHCEQIAQFFSQLWNAQNSHGMFFVAIFHLPRFLASAFGFTNIFVFVDNIEYSHIYIKDEIDYGEDLDVCSALSLLLRNVNYIISCEKQNEMFAFLDDHTELISTTQLHAESQYCEQQLLIKYDFEPKQNRNAKKPKKETEIALTNQQMIITASYCGEIPVFVSLWEEINGIIDEIEQAQEKSNVEEEEEENADHDTADEIQQTEETLIYLVQNFVNDMILDNEGEKIKVVSVRRSNK